MSEIATETLAERVGAEVRAVCARFRVTQADLAEVLHLSQGSVSQRLRGAQPMQLHEIETLAEWFSTDPAVLMGYATEPRPRKPERGSDWYTARDSNPEPAD